MRYAKIMHEARFWACVVLCSATLIGCGVGLPILNESGIPAAPTLAKAMASVACVALTAWVILTVMLLPERHAIGCLSGKRENAWEIEYQKQLANSMSRERHIG